MLELNDNLTVTDLKQYHYCARVVFYERCLPHVRPRTYKMDAGREAHEDEPQRAARRQLSAYDVPTGRRAFDVHVTSERLQLTGLIDEVVTTDDGEVFPVDYKLAKAVGSNHRQQLAAYGLLLEEATGQNVTRGFIYLIPKRQTVMVKLTEGLKQRVIDQLGAMRRMIVEERMPAAVTERAKCSACEFRRFCNDV